MAHTGTSEAFPSVRTEQVKDTSGAVLRVDIPVRLGGYTGQREQWEEHEQFYSVSLDEGKVILSDETGIPGRVIIFPLSGLTAAFKILEDYSRHA